MTSVPCVTSCWCSSCARQLLAELFERCLVVEGEADVHEPLEERKHRCKVKDCTKLFRNKAFAVKHLYNKHPEEVEVETARMSNVLSLVVDVCLYHDEVQKK